MKIIQTVALCMLTTITAIICDKCGCAYSSSRRRKEGKLLKDVQTAVDAATGANQKVKALQVVGGCREFLVANYSGAKADDGKFVPEVASVVEFLSKYTLKTADNAGLTVDDLITIRKSLEGAKISTIITFAELVEDFKKLSSQNTIGYNESTQSYNAVKILEEAPNMDIKAVEGLNATTYPNIAYLVNMINKEIEQAKQYSPPKELPHSGETSTSGWQGFFSQDEEPVEKEFYTSGNYKDLTKDTARGVFYTMTLAELNEISTDGLQDGVVDILLEVKQKKEADKAATEEMVQTTLDIITKNNLANLKDYLKTMYQSVCQMTDKNNGLRELLNYQQELRYRQKEREDEIAAWDEQLTRCYETLTRWHETLTRCYETLTRWHETLTQWDEALTQWDEALTQSDEALTQWDEALTRWHETLTQREQLAQQEALLKQKEDEIKNREIGIETQQQQLAQQEALLKQKEDEIKNLENQEDSTSDSALVWYSDESDESDEL